MHFRRLIHLFVIITVSLSASSHAIKSLEDILVGGSYRMVLSTGDDLEGIVYSKDDTSLVLDCKGRPYTFLGSLIMEYKLIAPPSIKKFDSVSAPEAEILTYENLQQSQPLGKKLEVRMKGGKSFQGNLVSIDGDFIKLSIDNSVIPVAKPVVEQIMSITVQKAASKPAEAKPELPQVYDTLIVKSAEEDSSGAIMGRKMLAGRILEENNSSITFMTKGNIRGVYPFDQILRVFRHTQENPETERIRRYALPLMCIPGMMLVDVPPGKANRPFLKVCIDKYEYPNKLGAVPQVNVPYTDAQKLCEQQEKRLCTAEEWQWACSGVEAFPYSYGHVFDKAACNTDARIPEASGNRSKCTGKFGAMDMTGNVFEWVTGADGNTAAMGGPLSKCQAVSPGESGSAKPQTGFRCCKSN
jgi:hypothetical protein